MGKFMRTLLFAAIVSVPLFADYSQAQKEWALGAGGVLWEMGGHRFDVLAGEDNRAEVAVEYRRILERPWGITSRAELLSTIQELSQQDLDRMMIGWNYPRMINLARWGYAVGYLQEEEAWGFIMPAAGRLQRSFSSWQELGQAYLEARAAWYSNRRADRREADYAYRSLLADQDSPWRKYPWNLDLGNGYHAPVSKDKTAWLELAAHPAGLICLRLTLQDPKDESQYERAIESAVGCRPVVKGRRRRGPDWILDTECFQPNVVHGTEIEARFDREPLAEVLRRDGVTQLFTFFEHIPHGSSSSLVPQSYDAWTQNGWQWYLDVASLDKTLPPSTLHYGVSALRVRLFLAAAWFFLLLSVTGAFAVGRLSSPWERRFPLFFWGSWLVLSVSYYGLAIAGFWSGGEGLGADIRGLVWYGTLALLLRAATVMIVTGPAIRKIVPDFPTRRIAMRAFWCALTEAPIAVVLVLLCDPQRPINFATVILLLGFSAAVVFLAWYGRTRVEGNRGGLATAGELVDSVRAMAKRMGVPLRRIYILPEDLSPRIAPKAGSYGDLLIPERLLRSAYRREVDGIIGYHLMLIKTKYLNSVWAGLLPIAVIVVWRIYNVQNAPSASVTLLAQAGVVLSAFATLGKSLKRVHSRAQKLFCTLGGDAEGWIAGLGRIARLAGTAVDHSVAREIAKQASVAPDRLPDLLDGGLPESGHYPVPEYSRQRLVSVS